MAAATKLIGTHSGTFHCDEALACYMLKCLPEYRESPVIRSRDPAVWETVAVLVDVGGVYDPAKGRFDHHQRGFNETFTPNHAIKLSSAGLIYKHFGQEVIKQIVPELPASELPLVFQRIYTDFIEALDANDNGVSQYPAELVPAYAVHTSLPSRVSRLNPAWNEPEVDADLDARFAKAMSMAGDEFAQAVRFFVNSQLPAWSIVKAAIDSRFNVHPSGAIAVLGQHTVWKGHLFDLEQEMQLGPVLKFLLYSEPSGKWRVQAVPERPDSFKCRLPLLPAWQGVRDDALSALSGIPGCVFVHANGFIGGNNTYEGALAMAVRTLEAEQADDAAHNGKKVKMTP